MSFRGEQNMFIDPEKGNRVQNVLDSSIDSSNDLNKNTPCDVATNVDEPIPLDNKFLRWTKKVERVLGLEARGIHRVQLSEQSKETTLGFMEIVIMWISINTAAQNITLASIGQGVFGLGFVDATLCSVLGAIVSTLSWGGGNPSFWTLHARLHVKHVLDLLLSQ
jgi:hypothetical protein